MQKRENKKKKKYSIIKTRIMIRIGDLIFVSGQKLFETVIKTPIIFASKNKNKEKIYICIQIPKSVSIVRIIRH